MTLLRGARLSRRSLGHAVFGGLLGPLVCRPVASQTSRTALVLRFGFKFVNAGSRALRDQRLWFYLPLQQTDWFSLRRIETTLPHEIQTDRFGHSILYVHGLDLAPYAQRTATLAAVLDPVDRPGSGSGAPSMWLGPQRFIESDDALIVETARELRGADERETVRRIYEFVSTRVRYAGYIAEDLGAAYALRQLKGDCTEYAALVVALCRAVAIPARMVEGYVTDRSFVPAAKDYHDWAEVFVGGRWRVVDAQKGLFFDNETTYIGFRHYWDQPVNGVGLAHRYFIEGEMEVGV